MNQPTLYLMLGYPGAGKTTISKLISEITGATHLWADQVRYQLFKTPTHSHQENLKLYDYLNSLTDKLLAEGKSVIFDTAFNYHKDRQHLRGIAEKNSASSIVIWVTTSKDLASKRATEHSDLTQNRILGNMTTAQFERISKNLEPPRPSENTVSINGTNITKADVQNLINSINNLKK